MNANWRRSQDKLRLPREAMERYKIRSSVQDDVTEYIYKEMTAYGTAVDGKKEYIERGALIRLFDERYITAIVQQKHDDVPEDHKKHWKGVQSGTNWCRNTVLEAPAADVV